MKVSGWGNYPTSSCEVYEPNSQKELSDFLLNDDVVPLISRGMGRSYGDSSLSENIVSTRALQDSTKLDFDTGELHCSSGLLLKDILDLYEPRGWFLPVTPGTKYVTVGGAIAADVHGKNHHVSGSFSDYVVSMKILTVSDGPIECSRENNYELFRATCGGMGLTGIILEARLKLIRVESSFINQKTYRCANLAETFELLRVNTDCTYSVAWVDCMSTGEDFGRSIVTFGEHCSDGIFTSMSKTRLNIPFNMPHFIMNKYAVKTFNGIYHSSHGPEPKERSVHYDSFFYPLDKVSNWNRLYGSKGFIQYQLLVPFEAGFSAIEEILKIAADSGTGSYLAIMKEFGTGNKNYLSFPRKGVTLSLDFKVTRSLFPLLDHFDTIISSKGGRVYLAKDSRMSETAFKDGYPEWELFRAIRKRYGADKIFHSLQSRRIGI